MAQGEHSFSRNREPWRDLPVGERADLDGRSSASLPSAIRCKLQRFEDFSGKSLSSIRGLMTSKRTFEAGTQIVFQGERRTSAFIIEDGWTYSSNTSPSGARQILNVQVPGDVVALHSLCIPIAVHDVTAISKVEAFEITLAAISENVLNDPEIAHFLLWVSACENAVASVRLMDIGRRTATERIAHFILELETRMNLAGLGQDAGFACPMTQYLLGDALGLTAVHVNRVLRQLRAENLARHHRGWISVLDRKKLIELAKFDPAYLGHPNPMNAA